MLRIPGLLIYFINILSPDPAHPVLNHSFDYWEPFVVAQPFDFVRLHLV